MSKKPMITSVFIASAIIAGSAFAVVTMDNSPTDERSDRRAITQAVVKMDKTLSDLLEETKKQNALMEELVKGKPSGSAVPFNR